MHSFSADCQRAREWASLRLDGELSELERALLDAHLCRCAACLEFEERLTQAILALRAAPAEPIAHPIAVSRPRRAVRALETRFVRVAAVLVVVVGGAAVLSQGPRTNPDLLIPGPSVHVTMEDRDSEQIRLFRLVQLGGRPPADSGMGEFGAVLNRRP